MTVRIINVAALSFLFFTSSVFAQTTAFNFQGRLNDGSTPANGTYDLQFKLFNSLTSGSQVGAAVDRPGKVLINGVFSTTLDFGPDAFVGGNRFLEISLKPGGSPNAYVVLGARQQILSVPTAVRAASAANANNADNATTALDSQSLGGIPSASYARLNVLNPAGIAFSGNVGIGTGTPNTRLTLSGGPSWTSSSWTASMNMQNGSTLGWEPNASSQRFGIGQTDGGLYFFRTYAAPGQTVPPANVDLRISDNGGLIQPNEAGGLVKAMIAVTASGAIARCYNGATGVSTCTGFSAKQGLTGAFEVEVPISFGNRFWLVNPDTSFAQLDNTDEVTASVGISNAPGKLRVFTRKNGTPTYLPFHLFVF